MGKVKPGNETKGASDLMGNMENKTEVEDVLSCKNCGDTFLKSSFLKHVKHFRRQECRNAYTSEELENLEIDSNLRKKEIERNRMKTTYDSAERAEKHKESYDPSKRAQQHKRSYDSFKRAEEHKKSYSSEKRKEQYNTDKELKRQEQLDSEVFRQIEMNIYFLERCDKHVRSYNKEGLKQAAKHFIRALCVMKATQLYVDIEVEMKKVRDQIWEVKPPDCMVKGYRCILENLVKDFIAIFKDQRKTDLPQEIHEKFRHVISSIFHLYHTFEQEIDDIKHETEITYWSGTFTIMAKYNNLQREQESAHGSDHESINWRYSDRIFHNWNDQQISNHEHFQEIAQEIGIPFDYGPLTMYSGFAMFDKPLDKNTVCNHEGKGCNICRKEIVRQIKERNEKKISEGKEPLYPLWWNNYLFYEANKDRTDITYPVYLN